MYLIECHCERTDEKIIQITGIKFLFYNDKNIPLLDSKKIMNFKDFYFQECWYTDLVVICHVGAEILIVIRTKPNCKECDLSLAQLPHTERLQGTSTQELKFNLHFCILKFFVKYPRHRNISNGKNSLKKRNFHPFLVPSYVRKIDAKKETSFYQNISFTVACIIWKQVNSLRIITLDLFTSVSFFHKNMLRF